MKHETRKHDDSCYTVGDGTRHAVGVFHIGDVTDWTVAPQWESGDQVNGIGSLQEALDIAHSELAKRRRNDEMAILKAMSEGLQGLAENRKQEIADLKGEVAELHATIRKFQRRNEHVKRKLADLVGVMQGEINLDFGDDPD